MPLIPIILAVLVFCVLVWAVRYLAAAFALPPQLQAVLTVLIVLLGVLFLVALLTGHGEFRLTEWAPWAIPPGDSIRLS